METVAQEPPGSGSRLSRSVPSRSVIDGWDKLALVSALLLLVLYVPELMFPSWTPRFVVLLGLGPVGVALLVAQAIRRDAAAIALGAALVWTITAGLLGPAPRSALIGVVGRDLSALTVVLSAGFWAIGRVGTEQGRRILWTVVVWGAAANGALALLQVVFEVRSGPLGLLAGRPTGFVTNPVYLGALSAAGAAVGMTLAGTTRVAAWAPASALCGIAITLSGSRVALLAGVLTCVLLVVTRRSKDAAFGAVVVLASVVAGVAVDRLFGVGRNAADRLATGDGGGRTTIWRYGIEATLDRPLAGYGFGRFRPAVQDRFSIEFVRDFAPDEVSQAWFDPHNVLIGLLVAVGVIGTLLFAGWLATNLRSARGPLVWGLLPLGIHWRVQPLALFTLPLAMLMLGAAMPPSAERAVPHRTATGTGGGVGLVAARAVCVG
ncbi:MAG: O-antigen ligase family protein, partial [Acidimicrobiia bacterium]